MQRQALQAVPQMCLFRARLPTGDFVIQGNQLTMQDNKQYFPTDTYFKHSKKKLHLYQKPNPRQPNASF